MEPGLPPSAAPRIATIMSIYGRDDPAATERALNSVWKQCFPEPVESRLYVAVDGPVPAELDQVIDRWRPRLHRFVRLPRNVGLAAALNTLIAQLEDEQLVFRMDADDVSHPDRYWKQMDHMRRHAEIDILGCDIVETDWESGSRRQVAFGGTPVNAKYELCKRVPVAHPTVCFRRRVLDRIGAYPLNRGNEDIAMWFRCAQEGFAFGNLHEPLLDFTITCEFWKRRGWSKAFLEFRCYARGIWSLHGPNWRLIFPVLRLALRLSPPWLASRIYGSSARVTVKQRP